MRKINLQCKSCSHIHSNAYIKLKVVGLMEYIHRKSTDRNLNEIHNEISEL